MSETLPHSILDMSKENSIIDSIITENSNSLLLNNPFSVLYPYIPILLVILIISRREGLQSYLESSDYPLTTNIQSLFNILRSEDAKKAFCKVCSCLDEEEQIPIHTLSGTVDVVNTILDLKENSYRIQRFNEAIPPSKHDRKLAFINTLKDYAHDKDKKVLEVAESIIITVDKVKKVVEELNKSETI